jgi:hypothetical protein
MARTREAAVSVSAGREAVSAFSASALIRFLGAMTVLMVTIGSLY